MLMEVTTPGIGQILRHGGCDFAIVDMEHSGIGFETAKTMALSIRAAGLVALIKPASKLERDIALSCDVGADGVVVPHVGSAEEALAVVGHMRYPPEGHRGAAFRMAHDGYAPGAITEKLERANRELAFLALIEDRAGLDNVEAIAAVEGVHGLCLGHTDLSVALGMPGDVASLAFLEAQERVAAACRDTGKIYCRGVGSLEEGVLAYRGGAKMLLYSGDVWILQDALNQVTGGIRRACDPAHDSTDERERQAI
jgi:2-dehydro-3-deoxyglucarate aldolase/4-hydroxy-2-oxoheptanedioate aldolase